MPTGNRRLRAFPVLLGCLACFCSRLEAQNPCRTELSAAARQFWIPVIGHGTDASGNQFDTVFKVINLEENTVAFNIMTCSDSGEVARPSWLPARRARKPGWGRRLV